jgi:Ca2+/Na+ antiporter
MNATLAAGLFLSAVGLVAYTAGVFWSYPGRSFSLTALMVGLTMAAIGRSLGEEVPA